jgi:hypothetical protein
MKRIFVLLPVLVLLLFASRPALAEGGQVHLRFIHASPDAPAVNIMVDGRIAFPHLTYGRVTHYIMLESDTYNVKVVSADRSQTVVIDADLSLESDKRYTVMAVGELANIEPLVLEDDTETPEWGKAKVRVVHASPDAPAVDVTVKDGDTLFSNVSFKDATDFQPVDAGTYNLEVGGTGGGDVVLTIPWASLSSGSATTLVVLGLANGEPPLSYLNLFSFQYQSNWSPVPAPPRWGIPRPGWFPGFFPPPMRYYPPPNFYHRSYTYPNYWPGSKYFPDSYRGPHYYWW